AQRSRMPHSVRPPPVSRRRTVPGGLHNPAAIAASGRAWSGRGRPGGPGGAAASARGTMPAMTDTPGSGGLLTRRERGARMSQKVAVSVVYVAAMFMAIMDATIVNVALPAIGRSFGVESSSVAGVSIYFLVSLAVSMSASGWLGDRFGGK